MKEAEIRDLDFRLPAYRMSYEYIRSLEISVENSLFVSGIDRSNDLDEDRDGFVNLHPPPVETLTKAFALGKISDDQRPKVERFDTMHSADVWVIEGSSTSNGLSQLLPGRLGSD